MSTTDERLPLATGRSVSTTDVRLPLATGRSVSTTDVRLPVATGSVIAFSLFFPTLGEGSGPVNAKRYQNHV